MRAASKSLNATIAGDQRSTRNCESTPIDTATLAENTAVGGSSSASIRRISGST